MADVQLNVDTTLTSDKTKSNVGKRIIICCDGTWFSADKGTDNMPSNVARISRMFAAEAEKEETNENGKTVIRSIPQIVYYQSGVGTGNVTWYDKVKQGSTGVGLDENVSTAYNFLCNNYSAGDDILLFGFSRGAYTARALSGLIIEAGILPPGAMVLFPKMLKAYKQRLKTPFTGESWFEKYKDEYGHMYHDVKIKFVGVWDTVGALGIPESWLSWVTGYNDGNKFHNTEIHENIKKAAHALALDEYRGPFTPSLWYNTNENDKKGWCSNLIQCWFPGYHGHIGGGTVTGNVDETSIDDLSLAWMVDQVGKMVTWDEKEITRFAKGYREGAYAWAEGNLEDSGSVMYYPRVAGGWVNRTPGQYSVKKTKHEKHSDCKHEYWATNEFIHPSVRYRMSLMESRKPSDIGYTKGLLGKTPNLKYEPYSLKDFKRIHENEKDFYWYWKKEDATNGNVIIREYQIPPRWAKNYHCLGLERDLVPDEVMKELDEGNNYGADGPLRK
ncbi:hypothetical protein H072_11575 [Dactylellina haptotyla CBS 200.50]|uniref:T6SS Phospholipase effector Tle1-like catalytic domain-containing protein n=1 Tax=Dactylellina haptotyla (strain CBS 200.50) TaxID=1284197 RepID=S7ZWL9_DACHA|nr:hypothetical protein H072_11575 [Dactylellina haptotyla CBS 200.50]